MSYQGQTFDVPVAEQIENAQAAVEQNFPASLFGDQVPDHMHLQPPQGPSLEFSIVSDEKDLNDDVDGHENGREAQDGEFLFSGEVIQLSDDEYWSDSSWNDSDSTSDDGGASWHIIEVCGALGACYRAADNKFKTFYRDAEPDRRTSCNIMAAALKEPVSLLTKYRSQRFKGKSRYFRSAFSGPPNPIQRPRQRSPLLINCPGVHNKTVQRGLFWYRSGTLTPL